MKFDFKKLIPHLVVIGIFIVLVFIYFSPLLEGKKMSQHDISQWQGMAKELMDFREKTGQEALWTNSMFGGMPAYQISVVYGANLLRHLNALICLGIPDPANLIFLCLLGFYLMLISLKVDFRIAIAGAIAYAFCSYNFIYLMAGHNSQIHSISYMPLVIAGVLMAFRDRMLFGAALTAIGLGLQLYANHLQITYYTMIMVLILLVAEGIQAVKQKKILSYIKAGSLLAIGAMIAILTNTTNIGATYEYGKYSTRSQSELTAKKSSTGLDKDYAFAWSYGKMESFTLLIPNFMGGASQSDIGTNSATYKALQSNGANQQAASFVKTAPLYWGDQPFTAGPTYLGAITIFLFVLGIFLVKDMTRWTLVAIALLFLMFSWGKNFETFNDLFFHYFPGYNKFRAVSMTLVVVSFAAALLGALGLKQFFSGGLKIPDLKKSLLYSFYITGGLCLFFVVFAGALDVSGSVDENFKQYDWLLAALKEDRVSTLRMDALRSLFFIGGVFGILWFVIKGSLKKEHALIGISLLFLVDMWTVDKRYLNSDNFESKNKIDVPFQESPADMTILADHEPGFRVMNTTVSTFNDASTSYFHHSIGGYHGAKLKRYQELIEYQISQNNQSVLNMLNTKYFIIKNQQTNEPQPQLNPGACGAAWAVQEYKLVANADSELNALTNFDPLKTVFIDQRYKSELDGFTIRYDSSASIKLTSYVPNHLVYNFNATSEQLVVFSEIYYDKGWNAYIDGAKSNYVRANYVLRAMRIPSGKHQVEFKFEPAVFATGEKISFASSGLLLLMAAVVLFLELKHVTTAPAPVAKK